MTGNSSVRLAGDQDIENLWRIPSGNKHLLQSVIGQRIRSLTRYSWFPLEEIASKFGVPVAPEDAIFGEPVAPEDAFSLTAGPLAIELESGEIVGLSSMPSKNTVLVWLEATAERYTRPDYLSADKELFPLHASDETFSGHWRQLEGAVVKSISVIRGSPRTFVTRICRTRWVCGSTSTTDLTSLPRMASTTIRTIFP